MSENINTYIKEQLFKLQDLKYKDFQSNLCPTVKPEEIIGVRTPALKAFVKDLIKNHDVDEFMNTLPHEYYEENNIHGNILMSCKDFDKTIEMLDEFLPYVNNWATCDTMRPVSFKKHHDEVIPHIIRWIGTEDEWNDPAKTYRIRFGLEMIMNFFLDDDFRKELLDIAVKVRSTEYYVNMMNAWLFATALAKQWDATIPYIENKCFDKWTHNKTIQKARESFRITPEQKEYLKSLKM